MIQLPWPIGPDLREALHTFLGGVEDWTANGQTNVASKGDPAVVYSTSRYAGRILDRFRLVRKYVALPSRCSVQCLAPVGNQRCEMGGLWIYTPFTRRGRLMKSFFLVLARMGRLGWAPSGVALASSQPLPLELLVAEITGEQESFLAFSLGTPGRFRKLTIQVMRPDGEVLGYIKLPHTKDATERVRNEAAVLQRLWGYDSLRPYIPKVLHAGKWGKSYILFQSTGPLGDGQIDFGAPHQDFLHTLWDAQRTERPGSELVDEVALHCQRTAMFLNPEWRELAARALERARRDLANAMIPCGISHGDFTPWNTRVKNGQLYVFDWERARWDKPILWDVFHFHTQVASLLCHGNGLISPLAQSSIESASLLLYLLSSACLVVEEECQGSAEIEYRQRAILQELSQRTTT